MVRLEYYKSVQFVLPHAEPPRNFENQIYLMPKPFLTERTEIILQI